MSSAGLDRGLHWTLHARTPSILLDQVLVTLFGPCATESGLTHQDQALGRHATSVQPCKPGSPCAPGLGHGAMGHRPPQRLMGLSTPGEEAYTDGCCLPKAERQRGWVSACSTQWASVALLLRGNPAACLGLSCSCSCSLGPAHLRDPEEAGSLGPGGRLRRWGAADAGGAGGRCGPAGAVAVQEQRRQPCHQQPRRQPRPHPSALRRAVPLASPLPRRLGACRGLSGRRRLLSMAVLAGWPASSLGGSRGCPNPPGCCGSQSGHQTAPPRPLLL